MKYRVMVLDFDGVIVESVGIKDEAFAVLFADHPEKVDEIVAYHLSHNATIRFDKFRHITENILGEVYTPERAQELKQRFEDFVKKRVIACPAVKGADEFLEFYHRRGVPLYLASVNPLEELKDILQHRGLHTFFKGIYCHPWKKDVALAEIAKNEKVSLSEILFIGDSPEDLQAAQKAGVDFIGRRSNKSFPTGTRVYEDLAMIQAALENRSASTEKGKI